MYSEINNFIKYFPERLQKFQKDSGRTEDDLADELGVTRQTISKWENGKTVPDMNQLAILCDLSGYDAGYFMGEYDTKTKQPETFKDFTGLSSDAVDELRITKKKYHDLLPVISGILENTDLLQDIGSFVYAEYTDGYIQRKNKPQIYVKAKTLYNAEMTSVFESFMNLVNDLHTKLKGKAKHEKEV